MILFTAFGFLWLLSFLWGKQLTGGLRMLREQLYGWLQVGDWLEERFTLRNSSAAPAAWLSIEDSSDLPGYSASTGTGMDAKSERRWKRRAPCVRRGVYTLGPVLLRSGDIFGLFEVEIEYPQTEKFIVSPPVIKLPLDFKIVSGRRVDDSKWSRARTEKSTTSISAREYVTGDSFSKIHWMITARQSEPYVRVFENIHSSNAWWVLLDLDAEVQLGEGDAATDERAIILAASLADLGLRNGKSVGMIASGKEKFIHLSRFGFGHLRAIMKSLALVERGSLKLADLIVQSQRYARQHSNVIVVTASTEMDWLSKLDQFRDKDISPSVALVSSDNQEHVHRLRGIGELINRKGIKHYLITPEVFAVPEARPGHRGEIQWKFTPHGRAIKVQVDGGSS
jgi:uncharacterized protein (DUF58 family)